MLDRGTINGDLQKLLETEKSMSKQSYEASMSSFSYVTKLLLENRGTQKTEGRC